MSNEKIFRTVVTMIAVDGTVNPPEVVFLQKLQHQLHISDELFAAAMADAKQGQKLVYFPEKPIEKTKVFKLLVQAAYADGVISEPEDKMLRLLADKLKISPDDLQQMLRDFQPKAASDAAPSSPATTPPEPPPTPRATCPKCGYQAAATDDPLITAHNGQGECPACGVIVARYHEALLDKQHRPEQEQSLAAAEYSIAEFVEKTAQKDELNSRFQLESPRLLEVNLKGKVWAKSGSMIGYTGDVTFTREGILEHGLGRMIKKSVTGEGASLMKMEGRGRVYLADHGKKVIILNLAGDNIVVNGNDLLALEESVQWDISLMRRVGGMLAGGLFNISLAGHGLVAITTYYEPITLKVSPGKPVCTDPNATVAWSGTLSPEIKTDISFKTLLGRGSGESIQLKFSGTGWVVLQPFEEVYYAG